MGTSCASLVADLFLFRNEIRHGVSSSLICTYNTNAICDKLSHSTRLILDSNRCFLD